MPDFKLWTLRSSRCWHCWIVQRDGKRAPGGCFEAPTREAAVRLALASLSTTSISPEGWPS
jgi:hypothetical protein